MGGLLKKVYIMCIYIYTYTFKPRFQTKIYRRWNKHAIASFMETNIICPLSARMRAVLKFLYGSSQLILYT